MNIERLLQICIAALVALSAVLLGMGQQDASLPLLAVVVSCVALYVTDFRGLWHLGDRSAALCALAAVAYAFFDLERFGRDSWLLAVANLLVYLQFILLFQTKQVRRYWLLMLLSVLEVAVATVVNADLIFGFLQVGYLFLGATTLVLFYLHRETLHLEKDARPTKQADADRWSSASFSLPRTADRVFVAHAPVDLARRSLLAPALNEVALVCLLTLLMTVVVFLLVPRVGRTAWRPTGTPTQHVVGASQRVQLGDLGDVIESPQTVMQVRFQSLDGSRAVEVLGEPLFRGLHLTKYENGFWVQPRTSNAEEMPVFPLSSMPGQAVRQTIQIEPLDLDVLYCVATCNKTEDNPDLLYDDSREQLLRTESKQREQFRFSVITTGLIDGHQFPIVPSHAYVRPGSIYEEVPSESKFDRLRALAAELVADIPASNRLARARRLESYFGEPGRFTYSLQSPLRNPQLDPIDDFLFERPQGHCEYFASALALMLRSVGIPSRLVLGFKGAEWNSLGGFYQVRQLHAHAWVEAYLESDQLPPDLPELARVENPLVSWRRGGWVTLDPTIASMSAFGSDISPVSFPAIRQFTDYAKYLWSSYVVGLDANRQMENIYLPIWNSLSAFVETLLDVRTYTDIWEGTTVLLGFDGEGWFGGNWISWRGGLAGAIIALVVILLVQAVRRLLGRLLGWGRFGKLAAVGKRATEVEFYRRLEAALARFEIERPPPQTQREFAVFARHRLAELGLAPAAVLAPQQVAEAFYRVRFGRADLDKSESETVEQSLALLEAALSPRRGRHEQRT